jgi:hypothetical protein
MECAGFFNFYMTSKIVEKNKKAIGKDTEVRIQNYKTSG